MVLEIKNDIVTSISNYDAIRFGTVTENVVLDTQTRMADYSNESLTENTRAGYPIDYIDNAMIPGLAGNPHVVIF